MNKRWHWKITATLRQSIIPLLAISAILFLTSIFSLYAVCGDIDRANLLIAEIELNKCLNEKSKYQRDNTHQLLVLYNIQSSLLSGLIVKKFTKRPIINDNCEINF